MSPRRLDLAIVGAGPAGLSAAIHAGRAGLDYLVFEQGGITDAIRRFPVNMTFFSTCDRLELGDLPFPCTEPRPTRIETLEYYRRVVEHFDLKLRLHTPVDAIATLADGFRLTTPAGEWLADRVVVATGYFDAVNRLNVPGEDLPHVSHYYDEAYRYAHSRVAVIGGRNSAVEIALDLWRHHAEVTLIHRRDRLGDSVKYWIDPDIRNRLKEGSIAARWHSVVTAIRPGELDVRNTVTGNTETLPTDFVFAMVGYRPDEALLRGAGVELSSALIPSHDPTTYETNVPGLYIAGSVACGCETWNIFIENGRTHAAPIVEHILAGR